jgi:hypothetical protein
MAAAGVVFEKFREVVGNFEIDDLENCCRAECESTRKLCMVEQIN